MRSVWFVPFGVALVLGTGVQAGAARHARHEKHGKYVRGIEELRGKQGPQPVRAAQTYVPGMGVVVRPPEPDEVFLEYLRAQDEWHAHGRGMDDLYCRYRKAEARWIEVATRLYGPGAGWTSSKRPR